MKKGVISLFILLWVAIAAAQTIYFQDDFEDGDISDWHQIPQNNWEASTVGAINGNYSLKHASFNTFDSSHIVIPIDSIDVIHKNIRWRFNIQNGDFDPDVSDKFWVYLMLDDTVQISGYCVGVILSGGTDSLSLWRITKSKVDTMLLTTSFDWKPNDLVGVEVIRDSSGVWEMKYDPDGNFDNLINAGAVKDDYHTAANYFGMSFYFRKINAGKLWLDDVLIEDASRVNVKVKGFLQGAFESDSMRTDLVNQNFLVAHQPYKESPWYYHGDEVIRNFPNGVVDWILVQLRTSTDSASTVATRAAFVRKDGMITDLDGYSPVSFSDIADGSYYVVLRHRNHLAIMSANPIALSTATTLYDFSTAQTQAYGSNPMVEVDTTNHVFAMPTGDANANGQIQNDDKNNYWKIQVGGAGYKSGDFNLNGQVQNDDKNNYWKYNVGIGTYVPF